MLFLSAANALVYLLGSRQDLNMGLFSGTICVQVSDQYTLE